MSGLERANSSRELRQSGAVTTSNPFSQREFLQQFAVDRVIIHNRDLPGHLMPLHGALCLISAQPILGQDGVRK
jgi:hypothetical protein